MENEKKIQARTGAAVAGTSSRPLWFRLDNAALIFPASRRKGWANAFRISFTFKDPVDPAIATEALRHLKPRFPSVFVHLGASLFWHYLEETEGVPQIQQDQSQPLVHMQKEEIKKCAIRVLYYRNRLAVEFFHSVTDGTGGLIFAKNLAAEYTRLRYSEMIEPDEALDIKDINEAPPAEELEDSFQKDVGLVSAPRDDRNVYHLKGTLEEDRFKHVTLGMLDEQEVREAARAAGTTVGGYLTAILLECLIEMQAAEQPELKRQKPVKVQIPVNLRKLYGSKTMRNYVAVANIGVDPRMGHYTTDELMKIVYHEMKLAITAKNMRAIFRPNVVSERNLLVRIMPLPVKNAVMRMVYDTVGETVTSLCLSNLGHVKLPETMERHLERVEFVLGPQAQSPYNVSATSACGTMFINIVRNTKEPVLEEKFFTKLVRMGHHVKIEANGG